MRDWERDFQVAVVRLRRAVHPDLWPLIGEVEFAHAMLMTRQASEERHRRFHTFRLVARRLHL